MADDLVRLDSFDDGLSAVRGTATAASIGPTYGLHGDGIRLGDNTAYAYYFPTTNPFLIGFNLKVVDSGGSYLCLMGTYTRFQYDGAGGRVGINWNKGILWSSPGSVPLNEWHYVEFLIYSNTSNAGYAKVWVDGTLEGTATGADFQANEIGATEGLGGGNSSAINDFYVDDLYVLNNCSLSTVPFGPGEVVVPLPSGNGNSSQLLGSDGNSVDNHLLVDENPPNETDYVGSGTDGEKDTYAFDNVASGVEIKGIAKVYYAQKTDSGVKYIKPVTRSGGTDYDDASMGLGEAWGMLEVYSRTDPDTAAEWTESGFNAAEFGVKVSDT